MKFSCTQENMKQGLGMVSHIASKNSNLPILHNVLVEAREEGVELVATNLEIGIRVHVRGKVEEPGSFTVPAQVFSNYIHLVSKDRIDVSLEGADLVVHAGGQHTKVKGEEAAEFPLIPEVDGREPISLPVQELREALSQAVVAVSSDSSRPELTGVLFRVEEGKLVLVATDSYRLAERTVVVPGVKQEASVIIPSSAVMELIRILPVESEEGMVVFSWSDSQGRFSMEDVELTTRLIDGAFPDYKQIIPTEHRTKVVIDRDALATAVKAASLFSKSGIHDVNVHISPEKQEVTLTSVNNQVGENVSKVEAEIVGDSNNTIFNYRYVLDALSHIPTQKVVLQLIDNITPGVFTPHGDTSSTYTYLIMPIKQ